ncbi:hypothetical protein MCHI_002624 [Candidatus Magnetoovum chiemensis]|nr:hypothetical protein MCHI_002624 [Candidatus Magnetoovum chiemensis]
MNSEKALSEKAIAEKALSENAIIVFAKAPTDPINVKSRLKPALSDKKRLRLYTYLLDKTLQTAKNTTVADTFIAYTPAKERAFLAHYSVPLFAQEGEDLGERMANAFKHVLDLGYVKAVIIGVDIPDLSSEILTDAFVLKLKSSDLVLGPSADGGYYLIGLKKLYQCLFEDIEWSSPSVFNSTIKKALSLNLKISQTKQLYDIDRPEDLRKLNNLNAIIGNYA